MSSSSLKSLQEDLKVHLVLLSFTDEALKFPSRIIFLFFSTLRFGVFFNFCYHSWYRRMNIVLWLYFIIHTIYMPLMELMERNDGRQWNKVYWRPVTSVVPWVNTGFSPV